LSTPNQETNEISSSTGLSAKSVFHFLSSAI